MFRQRHPAMLRTVVVNSGENAFHGVLWSQRGPYFTLRDATMYTRGAEPGKVDGDLIIHRDKIDYWQVLAPKAVEL